MKGERNYHVFYMVCKAGEDVRGPAEINKWEASTREKDESKEVRAARQAKALEDEQRVNAHYDIVLERHARLWRAREHGGVPALQRLCEAPFDLESGTWARFGLLQHAGAADAAEAAGGGSGLSGSKKSQSSSSSSSTPSTGSTAAVSTAGGDSSTLVMALHHIAGDGWSFDILISDFRKLYHAAAAANANATADIATSPATSASAASATHTS